MPISFVDREEWVRRLVHVSLLRLSTARIPPMRVRLAMNARAVKPLPKGAVTTYLSLMQQVTTRLRTSRRLWSRPAYHRRLDATKCLSSMRFTCYQQLPLTHFSRPWRNLLHTLYSSLRPQRSIKSCQPYCLVARYMTSNA